MPEMDGIEALEKIKANPNLNMIPVIMQTSMNAHNEVIEGLRAGAHYYLTKPVEKEQLLAIVETAVSDYHRYKSLKNESIKKQDTIQLIDKCRFQLRTLEEARGVVSLLASICPHSQRFTLGLSELVTNAIEHGNLGITYDEKTSLLNDGMWEDEVNRRLALPVNSAKHVTVTFEKEEDELLFIIHDEGQGFNWQDYINITPERAFHNHGRGIAMACMYSFDLLEYKGKGNVVMASLRLSDEPSDNN